MFRAYKFRLEPNVNQTRELEITLESHRRLYNACLEQRKVVWESEQKSVKYTDQSAWFKAERAVNPFFARLNFSSAQATLRQLDKAFQAFFRRVKAGEKPGYPRFKSRDRFDSFTYPSVGDGARIIGNKLIRINLHRKIEGEIKTISLKRQGGKWYVIATCQLPDVETVPSNKPVVALDLGLESFVTDHTGNHEPPLQPLKKVLKRLRVEERSLSRKKPGGSNRKKQRKKVAALHAKVANTRRDELPMLAAKLTSRYGGIACGKLAHQRDVKNHKLSPCAVSDAGWGQFLTILKHKAEWAGVQYIEVDARGTSQTCPVCGRVAKKTLAQRQHVCDCGYSAHRDQAAAQVILARGLLAGMRPVGLNADVGRHGPRSCLL